jgi:XRE family transcriptional regulator, fatty acid utilization regulator
MAEYRFVGDRLRKTRETAGVTRDELAKIIDRSPSMITLYELEYRRPPVELLIEMAVFLGVPVEAFFVTEVPA